MSKSAQKTIKKLNRKSIISPIIFFILAVTGSALIIAVAVIALFSVIVNSRYDNAVLMTHDVIGSIESGVDEGVSYNEIISQIQDREERPLAVNIYDENGELVASYGDEVDLDEDIIRDFDKPFNITITMEDGDTQELDNLEDGLNISIPDLIDAMSIAIVSADSDIERYHILQKPVYTYEYWLTYTSKEDGTDIYVKYKLIYTVNDCITVLIPMVILAIVFAISSIGRLVSTIMDIISQRYYLKLLLTDSTSGGYNEFAFEYYGFKILTSFLNRNKGYAIVDMSIVKYQNYCTLYGVEAGENLLRAVNAGIKKNLKWGETCARVAGGDFIILMKCKEQYAADRVVVDRLDSIMNTLAGLIANMNTGSTKVLGLKNLKFKSGLYFLPRVTDADSKSRRSKKTLNVKNLCIKAGIAKQALTDDSGISVYNHDMWEKEIWEQKVEAMMENALANEEFQVYIQPKYHPATEQLMGGEALVRWISPSEGFISPGQFIPIFERTGFITKLDDYMISHTAKLQHEWLEAGKAIVPISVNVSRAHFAQADLAEHICRLVDAYPLPHHFIEIELTESAFFDDKNALLTTVRRLQQYGFEVSMDDFGAGYSSLNSLKDLPLNVLKLDAEFFRGGDFEGRGEIVVSEAIALAKQLNMRIVAEGVEKREQVEFLAGQNCDMIQGFYFAKPMPASEYAERMSGIFNQNENLTEEPEFVQYEEQAAEEEQYENQIAEEGQYEEQVYDTAAYEAPVADTVHYNQPVADAAQYNQNKNMIE